jgi:hypothetical protein
VLIESFYGFCDGKTLAGDFMGIFRVDKKKYFLNLKMKIRSKIFPMLARKKFLNYIF